MADANMRFIEDYGGFYVDKNHSDADKEKVIYLTFDAGYENGNVEKLLDRNLTAGSEGEGMTFMTKNGETVLVAMDMGPLFINAFVREYDTEGTK